MKASDIFIQALENEGVKHIFGVPGEETLDLLDSIRKSKIDFIVTRHEQTAGFMAANIGRLSGHPGVCISTLGPGATNLVTPAAYAQLGAMPMIMITGQKPLQKSKQGHFQIIDAVDIMKPVTKFTSQVTYAEKIPSLVREAFRIAAEERPGAVHLELPEDVAKQDIVAEVFPVNGVRRPIAEEKAIAKATNMIASAKRPLLLIGAGANRKLTSKMLHEFVNSMAIPFFTTQMGKGVVDERHPLFLGTAAISGGDLLHEAVAASDLIINVGHDVIEKPPFIMKKDGFQVIHIHFFSAKVDDIYFPQHEVVGDIANALWQIMQKLEKQKHWDFSFFRHVKATLARHDKGRENFQTYPVSPQCLVSMLRKAMPQDGILALDNGMYKLYVARNYPAYHPNTVMLDNALATMGAGLAGGMAARLIHPDKKILVLCGDGGFLMSLADLETCVRMNMDIVVLIVRDDGYGMISWKQEGMGLQRFGLDFQNPDFVKLAESFGASGYRAESVKDIEKLLKQCLSSKGVHVIEVRIDYSGNERYFGQDLKDAVLRMKSEK
ncbi:MAG: acetolactate synthase large subunit [Parcubacteria group bacterium]|nr:acetolactate synthase large subunit [Parcubacteria group bacterium]